MVQLCVLLHYLLSARREEEMTSDFCLGLVFSGEDESRKREEEIKRKVTLCDAVCLPNRLLHLRLGGHVASVCA